MSDTGDFVRGLVDQMIDLRHPLAVLGARMPWQESEAGLSQQFGNRPPKAVFTRPAVYAANWCTGSSSRRFQGTRVQQRG
jgi:hypothetical protein